LFFQSYTLWFAQELAAGWFGIGEFIMHVDPTVDGLCPEVRTPQVGSRDSCCCSASA
jgi:hypothetical protein